MNGNTATTKAYSETLSINSLDALKRELASLNKNAEWMLVSPDGKMYKGTPQDMMRMLIPFHPLMLCQPDFNRFEKSGVGSNVELRGCALLRSPSRTQG
jgi:hypothetical protein